MAELSAETHASPSDRLGLMADQDSSSLEREARLWAYAISLGVPRDDAADLVQDAFVRLSRTRVDGQEIPSEDAWLFVTVHRLSVDHWRRGVGLRRALARLSGFRESRGSVDPPEPESDVIWKAVDTLPPRQRSAIYLRYRSDLDYAAIGRVLEVTESAARSYVAKGLRALERTLGPRRDLL